MKNKFKTAVLAILLSAFVFVPTLAAKADVVFTGDEQYFLLDDYKLAFKAYNSADFLTLMQIMEADETAADRTAWFRDVSLAGDARIDELVTQYASIFYEPEDASIITLEMINDMDYLAESYGTVLEAGPYRLDAGVGAVLKSIFPAGFFDTGDSYDAVRQSARGLYYYTVQHGDAPTAETWREVLYQIMQMYIQQMIDATSSPDIPEDAQ